MVAVNAGLVGATLNLLSMNSSSLSSAFSARNRSIAALCMDDNNLIGHLATNCAPLLEHDKLIL